MSAISSLASFNSRATFSSAQQSQAQRGTTSTTFSSNVNAARGNSTSGASSTFCPTCGQTHSSSYCPTCNQAGGRQTSITSFSSTANARTSSTQTGVAHNSHQAGQFCPGCVYKGR